MAFGDVTASVGKYSFVSGETITLTLLFNRTAGRLERLNDLSVLFYRFDIERSQTSFGVQKSPSLKGSTLKIDMAVPISAHYGLYTVDHVSLSWTDAPEGADREMVSFNPIFFTVQPAVAVPLTPGKLDDLCSIMNNRRTEYINRPIRTKRSREEDVKIEKFRVLIFGVGCLLRFKQQLDGYSIAPLSTGLSHRRMYEIVNATLENEGFGSIDFIEETERKFSSSTPVFLVSYTTVVAVDHMDALDHCRSHANLLFQILGVDRGQMPREFARVAFEHGSNQGWHSFETPWYRGNHISGFNPSSTANQIQRLLPKLQSDPFARLLISTYADATAETEYGFSLLRCCSVMELIADKSIANDGTPLAHPDGAPILNARGNPETTGSKHGRVYQYILTNNTFKTHGSYPENGTQKQYTIGGSSLDPGYKPSTELISLWDMVRAAYAVRNAIAHEGQFDLANGVARNQYEILAAQLIARGHPDPLDFIKQQAMLVVLREA